jgi:hypothetical protein
MVNSPYKETTWLSETILGVIKRLFSEGEVFVHASTDEKVPLAIQVGSGGVAVSS